MNQSQYLESLYALAVTAANDARIRAHASMVAHYEQVAAKISADLALGDLDKGRKPIAPIALEIDRVIAQAERERVPGGDVASFGERCEALTHTQIDALACATELYRDARRPIVPPSHHAMLADLAQMLVDRKRALDTSTGRPVGERPAALTLSPEARRVLVALLDKPTITEQDRSIVADMLTRSGRPSPGYVCNSAAAPRNAHEEHVMRLGLAAIARGCESASRDDIAVAGDMLTRTVR